MEVDAIDANIYELHAILHVIRDQMFLSRFILKEKDLAKESSLSS